MLSCFLSFSAWCQRFGAWRPCGIVGVENSLEAVKAIFGEAQPKQPNRKSPHVAKPLLNDRARFKDGVILWLCFMVINPNIVKKLSRSIRIFCALLSDQFVAVRIQTATIFIL